MLQDLDLVLYVLPRRKITVPTGLRTVQVTAAACHTLCHLLFPHFELMSVSLFSISYSASPMWSPAGFPMHNAAHNVCGVPASWG